MKVLKISRSYAEVYLVMPGEPAKDGPRYVGELYTLIRQSNSWKPGKWVRTVWSDSGSADDNIFPPDTFVHRYNKIPNALCESPSISRDGRYIVFQSWSDILHTDSQNTSINVYVYDMMVDGLQQVSPASVIAHNVSNLNPTINADARYIAYCYSNSSDSWGISLFDRARGVTSIIKLPDSLAVLDPPKLQLSADGTRLAVMLPWRLFIYDILTGSTATIACDGTAFALSANGKYVALVKHIPGTPAGKKGIYVRNIQTKLETLESISNSGSLANSSEFASLTLNSNARYLTFSTKASNLVIGDSNTKNDVFVRDRQLHRISRVSVTADGIQGNDDSGILGITLSDDGRYCAFQSWADNLTVSSQEHHGRVYLSDNKSRKIICLCKLPASNPVFDLKGRQVVFPVLRSFVNHYSIQEIGSIAVYNLNTKQIKFLP
jgi:hypothetical protein